MGEYSAKKHRSRVKQLHRMYGNEASFVQKYDFTIRIGKTKFPLRRYRSEHFSSFHDSHHFPTILYIPGTAYCALEWSLIDLVCTHLAHQSHSQVIALSHRLAPEYRFPTPILDTFNLLYILLVHYSHFQIDLHHSCLTGYSSGAHILLSCLNISLFHRYLIPNDIFWNHFDLIPHFMFISPSMDLTRSIKTFELEESMDSFITDWFLEWCLDQFIPNKQMRQCSLASPFVDLKKHVQTVDWSCRLKHIDIWFGQFDRMRSDCEMLFELLEQNRCHFQHSKFNFTKSVVEFCDHSCIWLDQRIIENMAKRLRKSRIFAVGILVNVKKEDAKKTLR